MKNSFIQTFEVLGLIDEDIKLLTPKLSRLLNENKAYIIQQALNKLGEHLFVDNIFGDRTMEALLRVDLHDMNDIIYIMEKEEHARNHNDNYVIENNIMGKLAYLEGTSFHYLKNEKGFTTPYGVYSLAHSKSIPIKFSIVLAKRHGFYPLTRKNVKLFNDSITLAEKKELYDYIYEFYILNFVEKKVIIHLGVKSAMGYFMNGINGGQKVGNKCLQEAVGVANTGKLTNEFIRAVKNKAVHNDCVINERQLNSMWNFYKYLVDKDFIKFNIYLRGWKRRLANLTCYPDKWKG